jgi:hypothetical protein
MATRKTDHDYTSTEKKMKRDTVSAYRARARATEALVDSSVAAVKAQHAADFASRKAAASERNAPVAFSEDEYRKARAIRTRLGWHKVVRVNAQSVTVETGRSWTDRIARQKVLEVRA